MKKKIIETAINAHKKEVEISLLSEIIALSEQKVADIIKENNLWKASKSILTPKIQLIDQKTI
ncbi:MAG: hypothetical protein JJU02_11355 [Cryomorphaceae bacterium]|nr:hypothetical protein [Cryomorphaceae bacterium]